MLVWRPPPLGAPAQTLCAVALTPIDTDDGHGDELGSAEDGQAHAGMPGLGPVLREHVQEELGDADEVDDLCDAEERGDDQGSAVRPFQEGRGSFLLPDLPGERQHSSVSTSSLHTLGQPLAFHLPPVLNPSPHTSSTSPHGAPFTSPARSRGACTARDTKPREPTAAASAWSSPERDTRLNAVGFSNRALGGTATPVPPFAKLKARCCDGWGFDRRGPFAIFALLKIGASSLLRTYI